MAAMTVSLEWLLAQHDLGLRLVAGVPARERLTWAHASDLVDPTPWLTGGELVLTTGIGLPRAADEQRAYVGRLAEAGVAGLGFGVGVRYAAIPAPIVAACSERKFPLLEVPLPTPFIAITQAVARRIAQQEVASLQQALTYQRRISRSAIRPGRRRQRAQQGTAVRGRRTRRVRGRDGVVGQARRAAGADRHQMGRARARCPPG